MKPPPRSLRIGGGGGAVTTIGGVIGRPAGDRTRSARRRAQASSKTRKIGTMERSIADTRKTTTDAAQ